MKKKVGISVFVFIIIYALWNGRNLILGPKITITYPKDLQNFTESALTIKGKAENVSFLNLDDRPIFVDKDGNFSEDIALLHGYNVIELRGKDRFGKEKIEILKLYLRN